MTDKLHPEQFGNYLMTRESGRSGGGGADEYNLWKQGEAGVEKHGSLVISQPRSIDRDSTRYAVGPWGDSKKGGTSPYPAPDSEHQTASFTSKWAEHQATPSGQIPLFLHQSEKPSHVVQGLYMTKESRHMAPTMLGMAQNASLREIGRPLTPSENLSPRSAGLVEHLKRGGVLDKSVASAATNTIGWQPVQETPYQTLGALANETGPGGMLAAGKASVVPASDVAAGSHMTRSVLRQGKKSLVAEKAATDRRRMNTQAQGTLF